MQWNIFRSPERELLTPLCGTEEKNSHERSLQRCEGKMQTHGSKIFTSNKREHKEDLDDTLSKIFIEEVINSKLGNDIPKLDISEMLSTLQDLRNINQENLNVNKKMLMIMSDSRTVKKSSHSQYNLRKITESRECKQKVKKDGRERGESSQKGAKSTVKKKKQSIIEERPSRKKVSEMESFKGNLDLQTKRNTQNLKTKKKSHSAFR